jgi:hypothetical protein
MVSFLDAVVAFPTVIFSTLFGVVAVYWILALVGLVDIDSGIDGADSGLLESGLGGLSGLLAALGLIGVPLTIVASVLIVVSWTLSCLGTMWLLPMLPGSVPVYVGGTLLALASVSLALPISSRLVKPLRVLFVTHAAVHNASLVGQQCKVLTRKVDEKAGRAEVTQLGANLNIRVWATSPNPMVRGSLARIVAYDDKAARYLIEAQG